MSLDSSKRPSTWRFALTNVTIPPGDLLAAHPAVQMARISRASEYEERIRRLKTLHGIDITANLEVQAAAAAVCSDAATDLCHLLSVACGTKVQWVSRVAYSSDGTGLHYHHSSRVTKTTARSLP